MLVAAVLLGAYPAFVLGYTWSHVAASTLAGGRHGPLDAYRHTLASAVVSYTIGSWAVDVVTWTMEGDGKDSNVMDRHNNLIGAGIGSSARSFGEIEPAVRAQVLRGAVNTQNPAQSTWLAPQRWRRGTLW